MADETGTGDNGGTVTLDADTSPFEAALDRAVQHAQQWGQKVNNVIGRLVDFTDTKVKGWADATAKVADASSQQVGAVVGTGIGTGVGAWFGGPAGAAVGNRIGAELGGLVGQHFDLTPLAQAASEALAAVDPLVTSLADSWDIIQNDASDTFGRIKEQIRSLSVDDFTNAIADQNGEAAAKVSAVWQSVTEEIYGFFARTVDRFREAIDTVWEAIKEPVAVVADWLQDVAAKLGLVEEGTARWADAIRSVTDVGKEVVGFFGFFFGYVEGLLKKFSGYVAEYVHVPLRKAITELVDFISDALTVVGSEVGDNFVGRLFTQAAEGAKRAAENLRATQKAFEDTVKAAQETDAGALGLLREEQARRLLEFGAASRAAGHDRRSLPPAEGDLPTPAEKAVERAMATVQAAVVGSKEANEAIIRAVTQRGADAGERQAAAQEQVAARQEEANGLLREMNRKLTDALVVQTV